MKDFFKKLFSNLDAVNGIYVVLVFIALAIGTNALVELGSSYVWYMVFMFILTIFKWVWDRGKYK